jgi:hypothetical protein
MRIKKMNVRRKKRFIGAARGESNGKDANGKQVGKPA